MFLKNANNHFEPLPSYFLVSGTISKKTNNQIYRENLKLEFWVQICPIYHILGKINFFLETPKQSLLPIF